MVVRESALGATVFVPGEPEGWEGWEDAARFRPHKLGAYLREIAALMGEYGYRSPMYGHYGQGCVHMRINFDFRSEKGLRDFREFIDRAADLVLSFGGSLSGEHGDGQSRAALLPKMFGPELMQAFREFKALWDPENRMNPARSWMPCASTIRSKICAMGRWVAAIGSAHIARSTQRETHFVFAKDEGSLERATERCVGVGACRKASRGVMCPSYRATGDEQHSTRGRARLLWEMLAGELRREGFESKTVHEALDLCLSCKACKTECPVSVDMAAYKAEFLAQHYKGRLHPLHHYIFGFADKLARWGSLTPALTNAILTGPLTSPLIKHIVGVAQQRQLPKLAARSFVSGHNLSGAEQAPIMNRASAPAGTPAQPKVVLWPDTWNNYYHPQTLAAAETVLTEAGFQVIVPKGHICCGRPLYDFGHLARRAPISPMFSIAWLPTSTPACPSSSSSQVAPACSRTNCPSFSRMILARRRCANRSGCWRTGSPKRLPSFVTGRLAGAHILIHGHCHHKAVFGGPKKEIALLRQAGATVEPIEAGCCGMAGPFGFEADKFEVSKTDCRTGIAAGHRVGGADDHHGGRRLQLPRADHATRPQTGAAFCRSARA